MIEKLTMQSPAGSWHMVLERDRAAFEKRGYTYVGPYADETARAEDGAEGTPSPAPVVADKPPSQRAARKRA